MFSLDIKRDIAELKEDVAVLKKDVKEIRNELIANRDNTEIHAQKARQKELKIKNKAQ